VLRVAALLHKAQALYSMGHFEKALVMFHRGSRLRPDNPAFRVGILRAKEAIMNIIGCKWRRPRGSAAFTPHGTDCTIRFGAAGLSKDFVLSSCEGLLRLEADEDSSMGSARLAADLASRRPSATGTAGSTSTRTWTAEDCYDRAVSGPDPSRAER
jgi:hypothetical protein